MAQNQPEVQSECELVERKEIKQNILHLRHMFKNARSKALNGTAVLEVAIFILSFWSNNSNRYFWRMRLKIKERFSLGGLFTL